MQQYPPPTNQPTVPHQPVPQPYQNAPVPGQDYRSAGQVAQKQKQKKKSGRRRTWLLVAIIAPFVSVIILAGVLMLGAAFLYASGDVLPGVSAAGVDLGGLSEEDAAAKLEREWRSDGILLRDGTRNWAIDPAELGLNIDAAATANDAQEWGRSNRAIIGGIEAITSGVDVEPRLLVDLGQARARLTELRGIVEEPARNAGIQLIGNQVQSTPPVQGRVLDIDATLANLQADAAGELADGALDLKMVSVAPSVTDATPLLQQAQALLSNPLTIEAYDPVDDTTQVWSLTPQEWSQWLVASPDQSSSLGLRLSLHDSGLRGYLESKAAQLPNNGFLEIDESIEKVNAGLQSNQLSTWVRIYHNPATYTVQGGDTLASIGYQTGIPYPWIQSANPGVDSLNPGQQIVLPSKDDLLPLPIIRNKRIVVSIPNQELWAYENGQLLYNWSISTGIARSPTAPGIFQIQSHDVNAYASQWNLYMPHFMGVYEPGPNAGVMNGFHGFPTDATGGYLLWTNNLGRPATYGCILLSLENAEVLYNWAEEGVVVEITG